MWLLNIEERKVSDAKSHFFVIADANIWVSEHLFQSTIGSAFLYAISSSGSKILLPEIVELQIGTVFPELAEQRLPPSSPGSRHFFRAAMTTMLVSPISSDRRRPLSRLQFRRRGRIQLGQRSAQGVEARGAGESVLLDGAPDCRRHCGELGVGEVDRRHSIFCERALPRKALPAAASSARSSPRETDGRSNSPTRLKKPVQNVPQASPAASSGDMHHATRLSYGPLFL